MTSTASTYNVTIFVLIMAAIALVAGLLASLLLDALIDGTRTIGIISALFAVATALLVRRLLGERYPQVFLKANLVRTPVSVIFVSLGFALAAGLVAHDLGQLFGVPDIWFYGTVAGLTTGLMSAVLIVFRDHQRNVERSERRDPDAV